VQTRVVSALSSQSRPFFSVYPQGQSTDQFLTVRAQRCVTSAVSLKREAAKLASLVSAAQTLPALAIVDDRLNGDGTGLPLGINDGALGIILATVPLAVFSLYFIAGKQDASIVAGGKDDDSGLSL